MVAAWQVDGWPEALKNLLSPTGRGWPSEAEAG
jgi:hypothetical protein